MNLFIKSFNCFLIFSLIFINRNKYELISAITMTINCISHRGAAGLAPENTMSGIDTALKYNVPFIEIDIQRSKDGILLLMHDNSVNRTTNGKGKIKDLPWSYISSLEAGSRFSSMFVNEPVPQLIDILNKVKHTESKLVIEVKEPPSYPNIMTDLIELIKASKSESSSIIASFDKEFINNIQNKAPELSTVLLSFFVPKSSEAGKSKYISVYWRSALLQSNRVKDLQKAGYKVWVWTVNKPSQIKKLLKINIDGIVTDYPNILDSLQTSFKINPYR